MRCFMVSKPLIRTSGFDASNARTALDDACRKQCQFLLPMNRTVLTNDAYHRDE